MYDLQFKVINFVTQISPKKKKTSLLIKKVIYFANKQNIELYI